MTDFTRNDQAVSSVIEFNRSKGYNEPVLTALKELLYKFAENAQPYDELAIYFDSRLKTYGIYYDSASVYLLMMNAVLKWQEICNNRDVL